VAESGSPALLGATPSSAKNHGPLIQYKEKIWHLQHR